jgi:uncharacterized protein YbjT (DUF2867 family)
VILVAGGTGRLGTQLVPRLAARGLDVRVLTRDPERARHLAEDRIEVATGDLRDPASLPDAVRGVSTVVSAVHGFAGTGGVSPRNVDHQGNANLRRAAEAAGVEHFVLMSVIGAAPDSPMELMRMKHRAEQELRASPLAWTIIRSSAFMELWAAMLGGPLLERGKTTVFGRGDNPINFVSVHDVAGFIELAVVDPALRGKVLEVGGPEDISFNGIVELFRVHAGAKGNAGHVPLSVMRAMSVLMRPVKPDLARQVRAGVVMDTADMRFDAASTRGRYPAIPVTTMREVIGRDYAPR